MEGKERGRRGGGRGREGREGKERGREGVGEECKMVKRGETLEEDKHWLTFHPVALKVFPAQPTVMVLSHIPGRVATRKNVCHEQ